MTNLSTPTVSKASAAMLSSILILRKSILRFREKLNTDEEENVSEGEHEDMFPNSDEKVNLEARDARC